MPSLIHISPVHNPPQRVRLRESTLAKCAACFIFIIPCDWEPCNCLSWFISRTKDAQVSVPVIWLWGWIAAMLHAWGDTASRVQVVAIRKFKSMTAQGQSPSKVIIFRHPFQARHLLPIIHQESKHKFLGNCQRTRLGMSQALHQEEYQCVCVCTEATHTCRESTFERKEILVLFAFQYSYF